MKVERAVGDVEKTVTVITNVLAEYEAELVDSGDTGGGLATLDPRRNLGGGGGANGNKPPPKDPCNTCGEYHWHADCPERARLKAEKQAKKKAKREQRKEKKAALAAAAAAATKAAEAAAQGNAAPKPTSTLGSGTKTPPAPSMVAGKGELMISDAFFEGGEQTVAISGGDAGGNMVVGQVGAGLVGSGRRHRSHTPPSESSESESSDSSGSAQGSPVSSSDSESGRQSFRQSPPTV